MKAETLTKVADYVQAASKLAGAVVKREEARVQARNENAKIAEAIAVKLAAMQSIDEHEIKQATAQLLDSPGVALATLSDVLQKLAESQQKLAEASKTPGFASGAPAKPAKDKQASAGGDGYSAAARRSQMTGYDAADELLLSRVRR